jgi:hypothetical protein
MVFPLPEFPLKANRSKYKQRIKMRQLTGYITYLADTDMLGLGLFTESLPVRKAVTFDTPGCCQNKKQ